MMIRSFKSWLIPLVGVISLLTLLQIKVYFHSGMPYTHDAENHVARFANYKLALKEGQVPPRFAPNLVNRYGYPVFNYNYPLANILSVPFSFISVPYLETFKILVAASVVGGLIGAWVLARHHTPSLAAQLMSLCVFGVNPYLTTAIIYRGSIGEVMALCLLPWLLVVIENIRDEVKPLQSWKMPIGAVLLTAFFLTHNVTAVFGLPLVLGYAALRLKKNWSQWLALLGLLMVSIGASLWFWLPALAEKSLVILDNASLSQEYAHHYPSVNQLLFSPMTFGFSFAGSVDSLTMSMGLLQLAVLIISTIFLIKSRRSEKTLVMGAAILISLVLLVMQLHYSYPLWQILPVVRFIQFPWRLGIFLILPLTILAAVSYEQATRPTKLLLLALLVLQAAATAKLSAVDYVYKTDVDYESFPQSTTTAHENTPKEFVFTEINDWQPTPTIESGSGSISIQYWKGSDRQYRLSLETPALITEPTMNFAGWQTEVTPSEGQTQKVTYTNEGDVKGRIAYSLEAGTYEVRTRFTQWTWPRVVGNTVSLLSLLGLGIWGSIVAGRVFMVLAKR